MNTKASNHVRKQTELNKRNFAQNSPLITAIKNKGCSVCGRTNLPHRKLHLDHLNPANKKGKISHMRWRSPAALVAELSKVRVCCVFCHADRHRISRAAFQA